MWYLVRCTLNRLAQVHEAVGSLGLEAFLPVYESRPLFPDSFLVRASRQDFETLLSQRISGLSPYYKDAERKDFVAFNDSQIAMLRTIMDSNNPNILVDQTLVPAFLDGERVEVVDGAFAGVEGRYFKYKGQHRVFVEIPGLGVFGTAYVPKGMARKVA